MVARAVEAAKPEALQPVGVSRQADLALLNTLQGSGTFRIPLASNPAPAPASTFQVVI